MATIKNIAQKTPVSNTQVNPSTQATRAKRASTLAATIPTPQQKPTPSITLNWQALNQILNNASGSWGAGKQIVTSAAQQAQQDRSNGVGIIAGMKSYQHGVQQMSGMIAHQAGGYSGAIQITPEQLGEVVKDYSLLSVHDLLREGSAETLGMPQGALANRSTLDLLFDNLGLTTQSEVVSTSARQIAASTADDVSAGALSTGASLGSKILGGLGAAYSAYQLFANWGKTDPVSGAVSGFTAGAYLGGAVFGPAGAAVGGVIGGVVGLVSGFLKSGKSEAQRARDQVRNQLLASSMINSDWQLTLANGELYDIGKDGNFKLTNVDGTTTRKAYDVDFNNPLAAETVGMLQPLAFLITGGNQKLANDFTGYFTNAALSNAKDIETARKNALAIFKSMKVAPEKIVQAIASLAQQGIISKETAEAYLNGFVSMIEGKESKAKKAA